MTHTDHPTLSRVLVCGSRDWTERAVIERVLRANGPALIVHGAARGADQLAASVAHALGWPVEQHPAAWRRYGTSAGPKRNLAMLDTHPTLVIAFTTIPGGTPGTRHTLTTAYHRGIAVVIVTPDGTTQVIPAPGSSSNVHPSRAAIGTTESRSHGQLSNDRPVDR